LSEASNSDEMRAEAYSYRADPQVPKFDDSRPLLIFDGQCVLCSDGVNWMLDRDPEGSSRFAAIQAPIPRALYRHFHLDPDAFDTFMVLAGGRPYTRWSGALAAARTMPAPWSWLGTLGRIVPDVIGDRLYDWLQRNRFRWFGQRNACFMPDATQSHRFL
jgi:predicted DCC family thiol-disulfide oxidoreductase YuxK